jgi:peroxiredoxin
MQIGHVDPAPSETQPSSKPALLVFAGSAVFLAASALLPWVFVQGTKGQFRANLLYSRSPQVFPELALILLVLGVVYAWRRWAWTLELMRFVSLLSVAAIIPFVQAYRGAARSPRSLEYYTVGMRDLIGDPTAAALSWGPWIALGAAAVCYLALRRFPTGRWPAWSVYLLVLAVLVVGNREDYIYLYGVPVGRVHPHKALAARPWLREVTQVRVDGFRSDANVEPLKASVMAPDFSLKAVAGPDVALRTLRGKTILVNFWATWCGPCVAEMPRLQQLYEKHKDGGFVLLAVSVDEQPEKVKPFMQTHALSFPALFSTLDVERAYGVEAYPTSFLIDPDGTIQWSIVGGLTDDRSQHLEEKLQSLSARH